MRLRRTMIVLLVLAIVLMTLPPVSHAQDKTIISVAVPIFFKEFFSESFFTDFEAAFPNLQIQFVYTNHTDYYQPSASTSLNDFFSKMGEFVNKADVLLVDTSSISPEATQAGYFLDLAPLAATDASLNSEDFYPPIWRSFQWDSGLWAIPFAANMIIMSYNPKAFDDAGLAYPTETWTLDDFKAAATALTIKDENGKVIRPGFESMNMLTDAYLLRSILGHDVYDSSVVPAQPKFTDDAQLEASLTTWREMQMDGEFVHNFNVAPLSISPIFILYILSKDENNIRRSVTLPGGKVGIDPRGFAVSSGTQHPQDAYNVAKFLSFRTELAMSGLTSTPARRSLLKIYESGTQDNIFTKVQAFIEANIENNTLTLDSLRFIGYLDQISNSSLTPDIDLAKAISDAEFLATQYQQAARDHKGTYTLHVENKPPITSLKDGRGILKFSIMSLFILGEGDYLNKESWDALIAEFVATDPQIGRIEASLESAQLGQTTRNSDCFYLPYNLVPSMPPNMVLPLSPYLDADPNFNKNDIVDTVLTQITWDNKIWAYPLVIQPAILKYDRDAFELADIPLPYPNWTIADFTNILTALKDNREDRLPFADNRIMGGTYLLMLVAANGGLPLDMRTDPPTIAFTTPENVEAMRQILDLAKQGYIKYTEVGNVFGDANELPPTNPPIISTDNWNHFAVIDILFGDFTNSSQRIIEYPHGSKFNAASYDIGTAYINANTPYPDACYRFIQQIAMHPELFEAMPARIALLDNPTIAAQDADLVQFYKDYAVLLKDPKTVSFPSQLSEGTLSVGSLLRYWLYKAWDAYVLKDADLDTELANAETKAKAFQECTKSLLPSNFNDEELQLGYLKAFSDCAVKVDEGLKPIFSQIN